MDAAVVIGAVALAFGAWVVLFGRGRDDIWPRTWAIAGVLIVYSIGGLALLGELGDAVGDLGPIDAVTGAAVGVAWLVATHVGHAVLCRMIPSFVEQVRDLYGLGVDQPARRVIGPILAMAAAEELLFRGVVQSQWGFAAGVIVYTAVQLVERKWALTLAGFLGGVVWGGLYLWTGSLLAAVVAHAVWTVALTLVWPLRDCRQPSPGPVSPGRAAPA